jgi:uncharacterized protein YkwD
MAHNKMILYLVILAFPVMSFAQSAKDTIDFESINYELLEKLALDEVNIQRKIAGAPELNNDNILYEAAKDQVQYINELGRTSHKQLDPLKSSARKRVVYYGGRMSGIGENAAGFTIRRPTRMPIGSTKDSIITIFSYKQAAKTLVDLWLGSEIHKGNLLNDKFQLSGLSIRSDSAKSMLYAIHVLGYK